MANSGLPMARKRGPVTVTAMPQSQVTDLHEFPAEDHLDVAWGLITDRDGQLVLSVCLAFLPFL